MVLHIVNVLPSSTYNVDDLGVQGLETSQPIGGYENMGYKNSRSLPIEGHLVQSSCFCGTSGRHATPQYCRRCYVVMYVCFLIFWSDEMIKK